jgi:hypothetical protein
LSIQGIALSAMPATHIGVRKAQPDEHTTQLLALADIDILLF